MTLLLVACVLINLNKRIVQPIFLVYITNLSILSCAFSINNVAEIVHVFETDIFLVRLGMRIRMFGYLLKV